MKNIQRAGLKILIIIFLAGTFFPVNAQLATHRLSVADSLFRAKQYTQSLAHYKTILQEKQYSPAMLLHMAYIEEGLNNIGQALYYLNLYYLATNDKSVVTKMENMAKKFNLEGYKATDADQFMAFYQDYHFYITLFLAALMLLIVSVMFFVKVKRHRRPIPAAIFGFVILIIFFIHINFGERVTTAVVTQPDTYVMNGPSAGAPVLAIITEGHRVEVMGKRDVWMRIRWKGEVAYVKNTAVSAIAF